MRIHPKTTSVELTLAELALVQTDLRAIASWTWDPTSFAADKVSVLPERLSRLARTLHLDLNVNPTLPDPKD